MTNFLPSLTAIPYYPMKKLLPFLIAVLLFNLHVTGQHHTRRCATTEVLAQRMAKDPSLALRMQQQEVALQDQLKRNASLNRVQSVITIPVVFHVIYNISAENVSDAQIQSQLDVLNEDFRLLNSDALTSTHPFFCSTADAQIQFCLATKDPNNNVTTGITRTSTTQTEFADFFSEKFTALGGHDNWDPTKYLNIWVCDISSGILGYAQFPSTLASSPDEDGVVIDYEAFGNNIGTASAPYNLGRTAVHEVGHWLNLIHIWGDEDCGNDFVNDTKPAFESNGGCPSFPHNANSSCGSDADGEMYMNYMDYVHDDCMNMFTKGQVTRMRAVLNGVRSGLLSSSACSSTPLTGPALQNCQTTAVQGNTTEAQFGVFPNPNNFTVRFNQETQDLVSINIINMLGETVFKTEAFTNDVLELNLQGLSNGTYYLQMNTGGKLNTSKFFIAK
jgi:hypothetical protein